MDGKTIGDLVKAAGGEKKKTGRKGSTWNVSLTSEIVQRMVGYDGVNWSGVARKTFVDLLDLLDASDTHGG